MNTKTVSLVSVKATRRIPKEILKKILEEIGLMFVWKQRGLVGRNKTEGALIRDDGRFGATIKTSFRNCKGSRGLLFHITIMLHNTRRQIGKLVAKIPLELVKATIIVNPPLTLMGNPAAN